MNLQSNANFNDLPDIHIDDFVHLIASEDNLLKCQVLAVSPDSFEGIVLSVHHSDSSKDLKLSIGSGIELVGTNLNFTKQFVHAVIKN